MIKGTRLLGYSAVSKKNQPAPRKEILSKGTSWQFSKGESGRKLLEFAVEIV